MWLKKLCAVLAMLLVIFSVSLVPAYGETDVAVNPALFLYMFPSSPPTYDLTELTAYPVPWNKIELSTKTNVGPSYIDYRFSLQSSVFRPLTSSGDQPTIYYAYAVVAERTVRQPSYITTGSTVAGTAYNDKGASLGAITQTRLSQMAAGSDKTRLAVCRVTLPHNTAFFSVPSTSDSPGFRVYQGANGFGLAFAYIVNTDDAQVLSYLDQIVHYLANMDADLDTVIQLLRSCVDYLNSLVHTTDDIAQHVSGIYDLLKNALSAESAAISQESQHVGDQIMMQTDGENYWKDKNTENFNALDIGNFSFDSGIINALSAVGKWFSNLWKSLGPVTIIFTFPLVLGISLVVVGRVSRSAGKGSKSGKGGDDDG